MGTSQNRHAFRYLRESPELIPLAHVEFLLEAARSPSAHEPRLRETIACECAIRLWLYGGGGLDSWECRDTTLEALEALGWGDNLNVLVAWADAQAQSRSYSPPEGISYPCSKVLGETLQEWKSADGLAALVDVARNAPQSIKLANVTLLPFRLSELGPIHGERFLTYSHDNQPLAMLHSGVFSALRAARCQRDRYQQKALVFSTLRGEASEWVSGASLGLAAYFAWAARAGDYDFSPFDVACSGSITLTGRVMVGDEHYVTKARAMRQAGVRTLLLPPSLEAYYPSELDVTVVEAGMLEETIREVLRRIPKRSPEDARAIARRINECGEDMRTNRKSPSAAKKELESALDQLGRHPQNEGTRDLRLLATMYLAAAHCHLGATQQAQELCARLCEEAPNAFIAAQALVRNGVNLTDRAQYDDALAHFEEAERLLPGVGEHDREDIRLQIRGSRGQTLAFQALIKPEVFDAGLDELRAAYKIAREYGYPEDQARNACYLVLAHALARPAEVDELIEQYGPVCEGHAETMPFFHRAVWLGAYRRLLLTREVYLPPDLPDVDKGPKFVSATSYKYKGSLLAASGDMAAAQTAFAKSDALLNDADGLLGFIHATCLLQAGESLLPLDEDLARDYLARAAQRFAEHDGLLAEPLSAGRWKNRAAALLTGQDAEENPQLSYIY